jgi:hypothetical protein
MPTRPFEELRKHLFSLVRLLRLALAGLSLLPGLLLTGSAQGQEDFSAKTSAKPDAAAGKPIFERRHAMAFPAEAAAAHD